MITRDTPSVAQYFSWINNNNEGATEKQTLINLAFFEYMRRTYGMQIEIYALDAGNLDCPQNGYARIQNGRIADRTFELKFPNGFDKIAEYADKLGIRLGIWGGPDGYGDSEREARERQELLVSLCRDLKFRLFKFDGVCGALKEENAKWFAETLDMCRSYAPDLILLNHRLNLWGYEDRATTFLWEGHEMYIDVMFGNNRTAPHHRAGVLSRGLVPNLDRLCEDHGVCISSCNDYWEDDLILQAFNRCLILAPEIYGNPWLLRDDELPRLARIYNLHRRHRDILVNGITLDEERYGQFAVSRGNAERRFITLRNLSWRTKTVTVRIDEEIGIGNCGGAEFYVRLHHPYEQYIGKFAYGDSFDVESDAFRACLIEVSAGGFDEGWIEGVRYLRIESGRFRLFGMPNTEVCAVYHDAEGETKKFSISFDETGTGFGEPEFLGTMDFAPVPSDAESLYESTAFAATNNSLEYTSRLRAGETAIPEVKAARDAFYGQATYAAHGCEDSAMFDGNPDTFFDGCSRHMNTRIRGGALRIDCGSVISADSMVITCFAPHDYESEAHGEICSLTIPELGDTARALASFSDKSTGKLQFVRKEIAKAGVKAPFIIGVAEDIGFAEGDIVRLVYQIEGGDFRYMRLPCPPDKIYACEFFSGGVKAELSAPRATNLFGGYEAAPTIRAMKATLTADELMRGGKIVPGSYLCIALEGVHGVEGAYCAGRQGTSDYIGAPDRAISYPVNLWSWKVIATDHSYTYYIPLERVSQGEPLELYTLILSDKADEKLRADIYLAYDKDMQYSTRECGRNALFEKSCAKTFDWDLGI